MNTQDEIENVEQMHERQRIEMKMSETQYAAWRADDALCSLSNELCGEELDKNPFVLKVLDVARAALSSQLPSEG